MKKDNYDITLEMFENFRDNIKNINESKIGPVSLQGKMNL